MRALVLLPPVALAPEYRPPSPQLVLYALHHALAISDVVRLIEFQVCGDRQASSSNMSKIRRCRGGCLSRATRSCAASVAPCRRSSRIPNPTEGTYSILLQKEMATACAGPRSSLRRLSARSHSVGGRQLHWASIRPSRCRPNVAFESVPRRTVALNQDSRRPLKPCLRRLPNLPFFPRSTGHKKASSGGPNQTTVGHVGSFVQVAFGAARASPGPLPTSLWIQLRGCDLLGLFASMMWPPTATSTTAPTLT